MVSIGYVTVLQSIDAQNYTENNEIDKFLINR